MTPIIDHPYNNDPSPGRTIYAEPLRRAGIEDERRSAKSTGGQPGWTPPASERGEREVRRQGDVEAEELDAAHRWMKHVEAGRVG